eukprot:471386-Pleurochrysis_carterae.AAC.1
MSCTGKTDSYYRALPRATVRAGEKWRGGWGAPVRWFGEGCLAGSGSHREHEYPSTWGAEREALQKYTCGASPIWGTVRINSDNSKNGPLMGIHSDIWCWRDIWDIPHDPIGCIRSAATFLRGAGCHDNGDHVYTGLRAICDEYRSWRP